MQGCKKKKLHSIYYFYPPPSEMYQKKISLTDSLKIVVKNAVDK